MFNSITCTNSGVSCARFHNSSADRENPTEHLFHRASCARAQVLQLVNRLLNLPNTRLLNLPNMRLHNLPNMRLHNLRPTCLLKELEPFLTCLDILGSVLSTCVLQFFVARLPGPHLIVVPLSVLFNWMSELKK